MTHERISIVDTLGTTIVGGIVVVDEHRYCGTADVEQMPVAVRTLFEKYEASVNGQMLSIVDHIEAQIANLNLSVMFSDGRHYPVKDLQIFPNEGVISFAV